MINWKLNYIKKHKKLYDFYHAIKMCIRLTHSKENRKIFKKHLHMKSKWMTNGLLRSIKMKDKLYKTLLQTTVNIDLFMALKTEFYFY